MGTVRQLHPNNEPARGPVVQSQALVLATLPKPPPKLDRTRAVAKRAAKSAGRKTWHHTRHSPRYLIWVIVNTGIGFAQTAPVLLSFMVNGRRLHISKRAAVEASPRTASKEEKRLTYSRFARAFVVLGTPVLLWGFLAFHFKISGDWYGLELGMKPAGYIVGALALLWCFLAGWAISGRPMPVTHAPRQRDNLSEDRLNEIFWDLDLLRTPKPDVDPRGCYLVVEGLPFADSRITSITCSFPPSAGKKTSADVVLARGQIAAQLGVATDQLIVREHLRESKARFTVKVLAESPWEGPPTLSPYTATASLNLWEDTIRIGINPEGDACTILLLWQSVIIGGLPRYGKSNIGRVIFGAVSLDPYVDVAMLDGKGAADWTALEPIGRVIYSEAKKGVEEALEYLESLVIEIDRRMKILRRLPREEAPQSKITAKISREYRMRPLVLGIDELQEWFIRASSDQRNLLEEYLGSITRLGPAVGVMVVFMTQKPSADPKYGIPSSIRSNVTTRIAVRCYDRPSSDVVLGEGGSKRGLDASLLPEETGTGAALIWGQNGGGQIRTDVMDPIHLDAVVEVGRQLRVEAGTLQGMEGAEASYTAEFEAIPTDILGAVAWVLRKADGQELQPAEVLLQLQLADPDTWDGASPTSFGMRYARAIKDSGIDPKKHGGEYTGRVKVIKLAVVHAAAKSQGGVR